MKNIKENSIITFFNLQNIVLILILAIIFFVYFTLITHASFDLFQFTNFRYDSLSKSLLKFEASVETSVLGKGAIGIDSIIRNGKAYMYFGPFPALLRIIPNLLFPALYGHWSRLSCLTASFISITFIAILFREAISRNNSLNSSDKFFLFYISVITFAIGTPLLFLICSAGFHHEAIWWGFCWSACGIYFLLDLIRKVDKINLFKVSICAGAALLSKVTFGLPFYVILISIIILTYIEFFKSRLRINKNKVKTPFSEILSNSESIPSISKKLLMATLPAFAAFCFQLWYNYQRYGSIFTFIKMNWDSRIITTPSDISCIPNSFLSYFGFSLTNLSNKFPYILFSRNEDLYKFHSYIQTEDTISLTIASPYIVIFTIICIFWLLKTKGQTLFKLCCFAFFIEVFIILSFIALAQRYTVEFLPFIIFLYSYFISNVNLNQYKGCKHLKLTCFAFITILGLISIINTCLSNLYFGLVTKAVNRTITLHYLISKFNTLFH